MNKFFKTRLEFLNSKLWKEIKDDLWKKRRNEKKQIICEHCGEPIIGRHNARLHHKEELTDQNVNDWNISTNYDNLAWVHFDCHNKIHHRFCKVDRKVYLVVGSPCSGKSTWVENVATPEDMILDFDKLWAAISINPLHVKNNRLTDIAMVLRTTMLEQIQMRSGSWINCYVLTTEPYSDERRRLCIQLGVEEIITMDVDEATCLKRLHANPNGRDITLYEKLIKKFYDRYQEDECYN